jgi:hypothetical protein
MKARMTYEHDNCGLRCHVERRQLSYTRHIPERRAGMERRSGFDRRVNDRRSAKNVLRFRRPNQVSPFPAAVPDFQQQVGPISVLPGHSDA